MKRTVHVAVGTLAERSYDVVIQPGLLKSLPELIARNVGGRRVFVITDWNVQRLYTRRFFRRLNAAGVNACLLDVPAGEHSKNAKITLALQTQLLRLGIRRDSLVIAVGGGVVGDLAGFVAATVLRGVSYIQVPTTLLAQVDSSVGGKVGINHPFGKNLVGAFHQPFGVYIDPEVLRTLPVAEFRNGLAEVVKIAAALDRKLFDWLERSSKRIRKENVALIADMIAHAVALKAAVIEKDEFESGLRKALNAGHTIGHALEAASNYTIDHGAAVAMGLAAESRIALNMGALSQKEYARLMKLLQDLGLPTKSPRIKSRAKFFEALSLDKKSENATTKFSLLKGIGHAIIGVEVPTPFIKEIIDD